MDMGTPGSHVTAQVAASALPDEEIVRRVRAGDRALFEILMRRHNQRIYRVARAVVKDENEVEDVMQGGEAAGALHHRSGSFRTWLQLIVLIARASSSVPVEDGHIAECVPRRRAFRRQVGSLE